MVCWAYAWDDGDKKYIQNFRAETPSIACIREAEKEMGR
jgi:hypothetical protein